MHVRRGRHLSGLKRNSAIMDVKPGYNPNDATQPGLYSSQAADLPLCRSVIVTKVANQHEYGPGASVTIG